MVNAFFGSAGPAVAPATRRRTSLPPSETGVDTRIELRVLSASQWRVCDTRWPEHDARSLLGFIEKRAGRFEVVQVYPGLERFSFGSLAEAQGHFARGLHAVRRAVNGLAEAKEATYAQWTSEFRPTGKRENS